jgi:hypothetical protein
MLDGIYSFEITFLGTVIKGIAMAENNNIRGFNWSHVYKVERSESTGRPIGTSRKPLTHRTRKGLSDVDFQRNSKAKRAKIGLRSN